MLGWLFKSVAPTPILTLKRAAVLPKLTDKQLDYLLNVAHPGENWTFINGKLLPNAYRRGNDTDSA